MQAAFALALIVHYGHVDKRLIIYDGTRSLLIRLLNAPDTFLQLTVSALLRGMLTKYGYDCMIALHRLLVLYENSLKILMWQMR